MKNLLLFFSLFFIVSAQAQTPFSALFGDPNEVSYIRDFTRTSDGKYHIHGYGTYDDDPGVDAIRYLVSITGGVEDSTVLEENGSELVYSTEETSDGGAIITQRLFELDRLFPDVSIRYVDADGAEIDRIDFGEDRYDSPAHTTIDEQDNFFVYYLQNTLPFQRQSDGRLRMINADRETVYDIDLGLPGGFVYDLVPLGDGEVVAVSYGTGSDRDDIEIMRITADGSITWRTILDDEETFAIANGFYDGEALYFLEQFEDVIIRLDPADGNILQFADYTGAQATPFQSPLVTFAGDVWIIGFSDIYQLRLNGSVYEEIASYPLDIGGFIRSSKLRPGEDWEFITSEGLLQRFNLSTQTYTVIADLNRPSVNALQEITVNVHANEEEIITGITQRLGDFFVPTVNGYSYQGNLNNSLSLPNQEDLDYFITPRVLALPDGGAAVLGAQQGGDFIPEAKLKIYDAEGLLISEGDLLEEEITFIYFYDLVWLDTGEIGIYISAIGDNGTENNLYVIDPESPDYTPAQMLFDYQGDPNFFYALEENAFALFNTRTAEDDLILEVDKISSLTGLQWSREVNVSGNNTPISYIGNSNKLLDLPNGDVLINYIYQDGDQDTELRLRILDGDTGGDLQSFSSNQAYLSASTDVLDEDRLAVVGCTYNLGHTGADDRYLLHYQQYDLTGMLLSETATELADAVTVTGLEALDSGFLIVYGSAFKEAEQYAFVALMNEQGEIMTGLRDLSTPWGELTVGPNPSNDLLRLRFSNEYQGELAVNLYSATGRVVRQWSAEKRSADFTWEASLIDLPTGTYWVQVKSSEGQVTEGWMKQ